MMSPISLVRQKISWAGYFDTSVTNKLFEKCRAGRAIGFADNMAFVAVLSNMLLHTQFTIHSGEFSSNTKVPY